VLDNFIGNRRKIMLKKIDWLLTADGGTGAILVLCGLVALLWVVGLI